MAIQVGEESEALQHAKQVVNTTKDNAIRRLENVVDLIDTHVAKSEGAHVRHGIESLAKRVIIGRTEIEELRADLAHQYAVIDDLRKALGYKESRMTEEEEIINGIDIIRDPANPGQERGYYIRAKSSAVELHNDGIVRMWAGEWDHVTWFKTIPEAEAFYKKWRNNKLGLNKRTETDESKIFASKLINAAIRQS